MLRQPWRVVCNSQQTGAHRMLYMWMDMPAFAAALHAFVQPTQSMGGCTSKAMMALRLV